MDTPPKSPPKQQARRLGWVQMNAPKVVFTGQISLGHILQIVAILGAGMIFALRLESRIDVQDVKVTELQSRVERTESRTNEALRDIKEDVKKILDGLYFNRPPGGPR